MSIRGVAAAILLVLVMAVVAGCGGGESEEDRATAALEGLHEDLAAGRFDEVCEGMTRRPRIQIGSVGHKTQPTTCERDLRKFLAEMKENAAAYGDAADKRRADLQHAPRPRVVAMDVAGGGDKAVATLTLGNGQYRVPLAQEDGEWKLADFFGAVGPPPKALR